MIDAELESLGILDFKDRIWNSNSHGELGHLEDYIWLAKTFKGEEDLFRILFLESVKFAEKNWKRPESIFQHMPEMIGEYIKLLRTA